MVAEVDSNWAATSIGVVDPSTGQVFSNVSRTSEVEYEAVVERARAAFAPWSAATAIERSAYLLAFAARLRGSIDEVAPILVREGGKTIVEAEWDLTWVADAFEYFAGLARQRAGKVAPPTSPDGLNLVIKVPVGVVAAIMPWNYPVLLWAWKAAAALAAGNTVIAKPSPVTPCSLLRLQEMLDLPAGVHQVVIGDGELGDRLVRDARIDLIAFTGSSSAGKRILRAAADRTKRVLVEMSGHDPFIVSDDVDIPTAVEALTFAAFVHAGQVCTSAERIYVHERIYDQFAATLTERVKRLRVGDPARRDTDIGPLATHSQVERLGDYVASARAAGASVMAGGTAPSELAGFYFAPTVLTEVSHEFVTRKGEIFGPIAPLIRVASFEQAIELANDSEFGLGANVLTSSLERAMSAINKLRFGTIWINNPLMDNNAAPFGGFRQSGLGRELGEQGYDAFVETKHVAIEPALRDQPWWFSSR